jgi:predicted flap endonuclease-1-like 5' DNA nuclease
MTNKRDSRAEANDIVSEAAAAASDVSGEIIGARVHHHLSDNGGAIDDLQRIKGVGPKLADMLRARGFMRFESVSDSALPSWVTTMWISIDSSERMLEEP